jgi:exopolysaccharide biosynthesis protein
MKTLLLLLFLLPLMLFGQSKLSWQNVDANYAPLPASMHVFFTNQSIDTAPFKAYYVIADLKDKQLDYTTDTTLNRRMTPSQFYQKNKQPLVVVNGTFFSFETNRNLNVVVRDGKLLAFNIHSVAGRGKDTFTYRHPFVSALGISKNRTADIAYLLTDSSEKYPYAAQSALPPLKDSVANHNLKTFLQVIKNRNTPQPSFSKWKMKTAIGGGPVLVQNGEVQVTNNEELKFAGKGISDKHPRTAMGYTRDNQLVILVIEGRNKEAGGATLLQAAKILKDIGCVEALNMDGGGSSCLLINGKETIKPSDPTGQRPVPGVLLVQWNN